MLLSVLVSVWTESLSAMTFSWSRMAFCSCSKWEAAKAIE